MSTPLLLADVKVGERYTLQDFMDAVSGTGPRARDWDDKPHRLIYDLVKEIRLGAERRRWKSVESAPRDGTHFLALWPNLLQSEAWFDPVTENWCEHEHGDKVPPLRWKELDDLPQDLIESEGLESDVWGRSNGR